MNKTNDLTDYANSSYDYFNGDDFITFDIIAVGEERHFVFVAVSNHGKITTEAFDLEFDRNDQPFFYFGSPEQKIYLNNFEEAA